MFLLLYESFRVKKKCRSFHTNKRLQKVRTQTPLCHPGLGGLGFFFFFSSVQDLYASNYPIIYICLQEGRGLMQKSNSCMSQGIACQQNRFLFQIVCFVIITEPEETAVLVLGYVIALYMMFCVVQ